MSAQECEDLSGFRKRFQPFGEVFRAIWKDGGGLRLSGAVAHAETGQKESVMRWVLSVLALLWPAMGAAQQETSAVQRCIWSCLAESPGASSLQYDQCVASRCSGALGQYDRPTLPDFRSDWQVGMASNGVHHYAGTQAEQGYAFNYFCTPTESYFVLDGLPAPAGQYRVLIGSVEYLVPFDRSRGELTVNIPPGTAFMQAVQGGRWMAVHSMGRVPLIRFSLQGAGPAIGNATAQCF